LQLGFLRCCSPVPGDEIVGFVTRGRGVSIHRTDCVNIINLTQDERHRLIDSEWQMPEKEVSNILYQTEIQIIGSDRIGLLVDISKVLTEENVPVKALNARSEKNQTSVFNITMEINGVEQLNKITKKIRNLEGVAEIIRPNN